MAMSSGILRYDLTGVTVRTVAGQYGFIVQVGGVLLDLVLQATLCKQWGLKDYSGVTTI